jgi:ABC-2 type transport system ATP-binding protein
MTAAARESPESAEGCVLDMTSVSKRFPKLEAPVLKDVDLRLAAGEAVLVSGRNGAGKTTLLRIASGLITPDTGTVHLDGLSPERNRRAFQQALGFLPAGTSGLYARLTVREHLDYWARLAFVPRHRRGALIDRSLEEFALSDLEDRRVDRMSTGQRQRVRIAMAFLHQPKLILLDEPAASLDSDGREQLRAATGAARSRGAAVLACSPSGDRFGCDFARIFEVRDGALVSE